jgi:hypothetical protein
MFQDEGYPQSAAFDEPDILSFGKSTLMSTYKEVLYSENELHKCGLWASYGYWYFRDFPTN